MSVQIAVIGPSRPTNEQAATARRVGELLAEHGAVVICGGEEGVMEAVSEGANRAGGTVVGVLGGRNQADANPYLTVTLTTGFGEARNNVIIRSADAVIAIGGSWGTLVEVGLSIKLGRPLVVVGGWSINDDQGSPVSPGPRKVQTAEEAVAAALAMVSSRSESSRL